MERLTEKDMYGNPICKKEISATCNAKCSECDYDYECFKKLAYYEDLEEDGRLVIVPCKKGDIVYVICTRCLSMSHCEEECDCETCPYDDEYVIDKKIATDTLISMLIDNKNTTFVFGKNVFTNYEEAEKSLRDKNKK